MSQRKGVQNLKSVMEKLREEGFIAFDVSNQVEKGFPDLMVVMQDKVSFIEVKGPKHKLHRHQKEVHKKLEESGFKVSVEIVGE